MRQQTGKKAAVLLLNAILIAGSIFRETDMAFAAEMEKDTGTVQEQNPAQSLPDEKEISGNDRKPSREESSLGETPREEPSSGEAIREELSQEETYHFIEEDYRTVGKWLDLYCPNGFEDILTYDEKWWNNLYDYEREYAKFLLGLIVELSEDVYDEQELSECIRIIESGVSADSFFKGTVFSGLTPEDLKELSGSGYSLKSLEDFLNGRGGKEESALFQEYLEAAEKGEVTAEWETLVRIAEKIAAAFPAAGTYALAEGDLVAKASVTGTGFSGSGHGNIYKITIGGKPGLCFSHGKKCRSSYLYKGNPGTYEKKNGHMAYFVDHAQVSGMTYAACQVAAWIFLESGSYGEAQVKSRARALVNISDEELDSLMNYIWSFYSAARSHTGTYYELHSDNDNAQVIGMSTLPDFFSYTPSEPDPDKPGPDKPEPEEQELSETAEANYKIEVRKKDWQTGTGLSGCEVELFEDGEYLETVVTDGDGYAEYEVTKSETFSVTYDGVTKTQKQAETEMEKQIADFQATEYTFRCKEKTAPTGYVWEANEKEETIAGEGTAAFDLTNERTLGVVELVKYDTESECGTWQGDSTLDGAVYGIYAAENITHQDKKTGVIYHKNELVKTAETGKSPKQNADGYLLNTNGKRFIEEGGEIAYTNTPGRTLFGDLELGRYYVKEIRPAKGYLLDESIYPVTIAYHSQMIKTEYREENAGSADNELTADDGSSSKTIYSGDYVMKQGIRFVKTADNSYQTELQPIEGAGFSVYLISDLSGVKSGNILPMGEDWTADDIMTFYEYDFTDEPKVTVYKRQSHEEWTKGDKLWLEAGEKENEYHVKEMFTDADGYIETPELPYGTYVVVETTTPRNYVCAKPFIVYITGDGGVLYTDATKQKIEETYMPEKGIRYGDHRDRKEREGRLLQKQRIINNTITKTFLRIVKADEEFTVDTGTYITAEEFVRGTILKEGAAYRLKCLSPELSGESLKALNWKWNKEGYMSYYDANAKRLSGTEENPFCTDFLKKNGKIKDCYITLPQEIPVGIYQLEETAAPEGYVINGKEQTIEDVSTEEENGFRIKDTPYDKVIFTVNNGSVYPDGQMGTNKYALLDEYGNLTVTVLQKNQEQKGIIEIYKHGEQLSEVHDMKKTDETEQKAMVFEYQDAPIEGAGFEIIAAEDIYTQELQEDLRESYDISPEDYLIWHQGEVAATVTTDKNGYGYASNLYIGKYRIREITAGSGFVLNTTETEFEITGKEQTVNFDFHAADYKNERQKLRINVKKYDKDSGEPLAGAVYGLYAKEDITTNIILNAAGDKWIARKVPEVIYPADTLIATCVTEKNGEGIFDEDLPLGQYYVRELEAPAGYLKALEEITLDGSYEGAKGGQNTKIQKHMIAFRNRKTQAVITKQDITHKKEIPGAELEIKEVETDKEGNPRKTASGEYLSKTVFSWVSKGEGEEIHYFYKEDSGYLKEIADKDNLPAGKELIRKEGHLIEGLQTGQIYILSEKTAPYGYGYGEEILFKLVQEEKDGKMTETTNLYVKDGESWKRPEEGILVMYDEKQALAVEKSTIRMTQWGDNYKYSIDRIENLTDEPLEQFTVTDRLPEAVYLTELWTGTYNEILKYDVEYRTNGNAEWKRWESGLTTDENHHLMIPQNLRTEKEHVTGFRLCFGTVGGGFQKEISPVFFTTVLPDAKGILINKIELTAEQNGKLLRDKDETETVLYYKRIAGYRARGGGEPLYEVIETEKEVKEKALIIKKRTEELFTEKQSEPEEPESRKNSQEGAETKISVKTGDKTPVGILLLLSGISGAMLLLLRCKKMNGKKENER